MLGWCCSNRVPLKLERKCLLGRFAEFLLIVNSSTTESGLHGRGVRSSLFGPSDIFLVNVNST